MDNKLNLVISECPTIDPRREIVSDSEESCGSIESEKYPMLSGKKDKDISFQGVPKNLNGNCMPASFVRR